MFVRVCLRLVCVLVCLFWGGGNMDVCVCVCVRVFVFSVCVWGGRVGEESTPCNLTARPQVYNFSEDG